MAMHDFIETNHIERGHRFFPSKHELETIPELYETEHQPAEEKTIFVHYFLKDCDWWVAELQPETGDGFGYVRLHGDDSNAEWGYFDLRELEGLLQKAHLEWRADGGGRFLPRLIVERDLYWRPRPFGQIVPASVSG